MNEEIKSVIKLMEDRASKGDLKADEALKLSQAALNLAHVMAVMSQIK